MIELFVEQGKNRRECMGKIVEKFGERVVITRQRTVPIGGFLGMFTRDGVELEFYIPPQVPGAYAGQSSRNIAAQPPGDLEEVKKKLIEAAGKDPSMINRNQPLLGAVDISQSQIMDELLEIKKKLGASAEKKEEHPSLVRITELLRLNDFSDAYINAMLEKARGELPLEILDNFGAVQDRLLEWIGDTIRIYKEPFVQTRSAMRPDGQIVALVGPTGVGKTTTIAKLAAIYGLGVNNSGKMPLSVRIITIDAFRIAARAQIETYGEIMKIPVSYVDNRRELRKEIALYQEESDLILIDTTGKSPKDSSKIGDMKEMLDVCGSRLETHLVLSASTKTSDVAGILRQFEPFDYRSVIMTKLDETSHVGNIISALADKGKAVSYITDGQKVPDYISRAEVVTFLINLDEFTVNREKIEKRFPVEEGD